jgi:GNAT superfamily N-acetyltransferase
MIVFAREVYVCACETRTPLRGGHNADDGRMHHLRFRCGAEADLESLDRRYHAVGHIEELRERLRRNETWLLGVADGRIVTYTWLHARRVVNYPYIPNCEFEVAPCVGYGYDAWTLPELRGQGLRRRAFVEELQLLGNLGLTWETSFFVKHQLDGAARSLGREGIILLPLWRVSFDRRRELIIDRLDQREIIRPLAQRKT